MLSLFVSIVSSLSSLSSLLPLSSLPSLSSLSSLSSPSSSFLFSPRLSSSLLVSPLLSARYLEGGLAEEGEEEEEPDGVGLVAAETLGGGAPRMGEEARTEPLDRGGDEHVDKVLGPPRAVKVLVPLVLGTPCAAHERHEMVIQRGRVGERDEEGIPVHRLELHPHGGLAAASPPEPEVRLAPGRQLAAAERRGKVDDPSVLLRDAVGERIALQAVDVEHARRLELAEQLHQPGRGGGGGQSATRAMLSGHHDSEDALPSVRFARFSLNVL